MNDQASKSTDMDMMDMIHAADFFIMEIFWAPFLAVARISNVRTVVSD